MYTANHLKVKAIIALTESGSTTLWMSRVRSDIPIYAFTRHERTRRRVTLYRGVYPVPFDVVHTGPSKIHESAVAVLRKADALLAGDLVIFTKGEFEGIAGGTNTMQIYTVPDNHVE
jgi:pyruvate kinase